MSQGTLRNICELLDDVETIEIPVIQRDYAQGRAEAREIREDFLSAIERAITQNGASLNLDFIYGSIEDGATRTLSVLDGQQRLTTLFLLHWYLAAKDGELADFRQRWKTADGRARFQYSTRPGAGAFFRALVLNDFDPHTSGSSNDLSDRITDAKWFIAAWKRDPTVHSALVMLDSLDKRFKDKEGLHQRLTMQSPITFQYLELKDFGLRSDELYIKMNSRGKPLTPFENFKAWLVGRVSRASFASRLDQEWVDYFWTLAGRHSAVGFDELFLRFFYLCAYFERALKIEYVWTLRSTTESWLNQLRADQRFVPLRTFDENGALQPGELAEVETILDFLTLGQLGDHSAVVHAALEPRASYDAQLRLYARMVFVRATKGRPAHHGSEAFRRWTRVTENLIANSRVDDLSSMVGAVRGLAALSTHATELYEALANGAVGAIGFAKDQVDEESSKAKLMLADAGWESLILEAEAHWYLRGRIRAILALSARGASEPQMPAFRKAIDAVARLVTPEMLESTDYPLQRALLALYDFLPLATSGNHTFCVGRATTFRDRQDNWLSVIEDSRFAQLLDQVGSDAMASLNAIVASSAATGWRECLINEPRLFQYCKRSLLRREGPDVFLLSKSRLLGWYAEVRSCALYFVLENRQRSGNLAGISGLRYVEVHGSGVYPGLAFQSDGSYEVRFADGRWECLKDGHEHDLPAAVAEVAETIS